MASHRIYRRRLKRGRSGNEHSLRAYCARHAIPYDDVSKPVALSTFVDYACDFQRRLVPEVDERHVAKISARNGSFELVLDDGRAVEARRVVLAAGISHFDHVPGVLTALPGEVVSHSSAHHEVDHFKNRDVTVIGAGASAVDLSALLHERLAPRGSPYRAKTCNSLWLSTGAKWKKRMAKNSPPAIRSGSRPQIPTACDLPQLFRYLPSSLRLEIVHRHLGPSPAWHLASRVVDKVSIILGHEITEAKMRGRLVQLNFRTAAGGS